MSEKNRKDEAKSPRVAEVTWRGQSFTVPREYGDFSVDLVESLEEGKSVGIIRGALGPDQWRRVKATEPKMRDLDELAGAIATALGFGSVGE